MKKRELRKQLRALAVTVTRQDDTINELREAVRKGAGVNMALSNDLKTLINGKNLELRKVRLEAYEAGVEAGQEQEREWQRQHSAREEKPSEQLNHRRWPWVKP